LIATIFGLLLSLVGQSVAKKGLNDKVRTAPEVAFSRT
jgi:hypothetical protein